MTTKGPLFRNRAALGGWVFMGFWLGMLGMFTWLFIREGGFGQFSYGTEVAIVGFFWLGGLVGGAHFFRQPLIFVLREGEAVIVTERWPLGRRIRTAGLAEIAPSRVEMTVDSDGDEHFTCLFGLPDGTDVPYYSTIVRANADAELARFTAAMR